ncbi:MAG: DUF1080 domain-containing protein [Cyclobacteriaceae bacterium]|nr:DUF1080 domain-containing protein [Cyclobacteriaceae bacterium]
MKNLHTFLFIGILSLFTISCKTSNSTDENSTTTATTIPLFQENVKGWSVFGGGSWKFENNELTGTVQDTMAFVMTNNKYKNFVLKMEFYPDSTINSGVFVRCKNEVISDTDCYEVNIWDSRPDPEYRTGAIVKITKPLEYVETINKWNTIEIKCENDHKQVWVNGILTADVTEQSLVDGYIGLQAGGTGVMKFRNIEITPLELP